MQLSFNGKKLIQELEGFKAQATLVGGVYVVGYGTTTIDGRPVEAGQTCNEAQAQIWLEEALALAQTAVNTLVKTKLSQPMFDALVSFVYSVGVNAFARSTMLQLLNSGQYVAASRQFDQWVYDKGKLVKELVSRRREERSLFEQ